MKFLVSLLAGLGIAAANGTSNACTYWITDEPKCPKSLIK